MYIGSYVFIKERCISELRKKNPELASSLAYKVGKIVGFDGTTWTFNVKFGDEEYSLRRYQLEEISEKELQLVNSISGNWKKMSSVQSYYVIAILYIYLHLKQINIKDGNGLRHGRTTHVISQEEKFSCSMIQRIYILDIFWQQEMNTVSTPL